MTFNTLSRYSDIGYVRYAVINTALDEVNLNSTTQLYLIDCTLGNIVVYLPFTFANNGKTKKLTIKKIDNTANTITVKSKDGWLIDGATSRVLSTPYQKETYVSYNNQFYTI